MHSRDAVGAQNVFGNVYLELPSDPIYKSGRKIVLALSNYLFYFF
jgi:hypothetical protein